MPERTLETKMPESTPKTVPGNVHENGVQANQASMHRATSCIPKQHNSSGAGELLGMRDFTVARTIQGAAQYLMGR